MKYFLYLVTVPTVPGGLVLLDFLQAHHALRHSLQTQVSQSRSKIAVFLLRPSSMVFFSCPTLVCFVEILVFISPRLAIIKLTPTVPAPVFLAEIHLMKVFLRSDVGAVSGVVMILPLITRSAFSSTSVGSLLLMVAPFAVVRRVISFERCEASILSPVVVIIVVST